MFQNVANNYCTIHYKHIIQQFLAIWKNALFQFHYHCIIQCMQEMYKQWMKYTKTLEHHWPWIACKVTTVRMEAHLACCLGSEYASGTCSSHLYSVGNRHGSVSKCKPIPTVAAVAAMSILCIFAICWAIRLHQDISQYTTILLLPLPFLFPIRHIKIALRWHLHRGWKNKHQDYCMKQW